MGWSIGYDERWQRDIGYGVPAQCDHPDCTEEIDRGLSHVCCSERVKGGDAGCGLYFCEKHHNFYPVTLVKLDGQVVEEIDEDSEAYGMCERCAHSVDPFTPKPDLKEWIDFKLTDYSWAEWRAENGIPEPPKYPYQADVTWFTPDDYTTKRLGEVVASNEDGAIEVAMKKYAKSIQRKAKAKNIGFLVTAAVVV